MMKNVKNEIITSMLNVLGIGINAYIPNNSPRHFMILLGKLLPKNNIVLNEIDDKTFEIVIDNEVKLNYGFVDNRIISLTIT